MPRAYRRGVVAAAACLVLTSSGQVTARDGTRDYPHSTHCPVKTGPSVNGDVTATSPRTVLTFVTCDNRSVFGTDPLAPPSEDPSEPPIRRDVGYRLSLSI